LVIGIIRRTEKNYPTKSLYSPGYTIRAFGIYISLDLVLYFSDDIIVALATPPGKSALAVIRLSGKGCLELFRSCLKKQDAIFRPWRASLAEIMDVEEPIDQAIVIYYQAPKSYTGEDLMEIICHGGEYVVERVMEVLIDKGARPAQAGEMTFRAFIEGKLDLTQAEAVSDIISAQSRFAHRNAIAQLHGGLSAKISAIKKELIEILSEIEVEIEFPEDEPLVINYEDWNGKLLEALREIEGLYLQGLKGKSAREGFRVTIAGPPNSGKSTLLNALLGEERAIVHHIPGTTRDTLRESLEIGGVRIWLSDTAGLRSNADEVESEGIKRTHREIQTGDLVIYLFDLQEGLKIESDSLSSHNILFVGNKLDICSGEEIVCDLKISALKGIGLEGLKSAVMAKALGDWRESGIVANQRHLSSLKEAMDYLKSALALCQSRGESELLALEIRSSASALGEILGEGVTEEVLETIFSRFCIGK
jgi:tRNA modification GTPase